MNTTNKVCSHINHLFSHPLCSSQHLIRRVANVFFHIFTFGVPLAAYHVVKCCISIVNSIHSSYQTHHAIQSVRRQLDIKSDSPERQEAFSYAYSLMEGKSLSSARWYGEKLSKNENQQYTYARYAHLNAPINSAIAFLASHLMDNAGELNPDERMKISYVIGCLMLEELPRFIQKYPTYQDRQDQDQERTFVAALTRQDSYQYKLFFACPTAYYQLRISGSEQNFYEAGTLESSWRVLYNDYCDRVVKIVLIEDLKKSDQRHAAFIGQDLSGESFNKEPGGIPT